MGTHAHPCPPTATKRTRHAYHCIHNMAHPPFSKYRKAGTPEASAATPTCTSPVSKVAHSDTPRTPAESNFQDQKFSLPCMHVAKAWVWRGHDEQFDKKLNFKTRCPSIIRLDDRWWAPTCCPFSFKSVHDDSSCASDPHLADTPRVSRQPIHTHTHTTTCSFLTIVTCFLTVNLLSSPTVSPLANTYRQDSLQ
jgi:hypothetical protein